MHRFSVKLQSAFRRTLATRWQWPAVALAKVETMIDVSVETTRPMEPGSGPDEYASRKPFRAVITVRSTVIRRNFIIPVRTNGRPFNSDSNLRAWVAASYSRPGGESQKGKEFPRVHGFTSGRRLRTPRAIGLRKSTSDSATKARLRVKFERET
jgi:hypothetical protein